MSPTNVDAGDLLTVTIVVSNRTDATANAYDLVVTDLLAAAYYDAATFTNTYVQAGWNWATNPVGPDLNLVFSSDAGVPLAPGAAVSGRRRAV